MTKKFFGLFLNEPAVYIRYALLVGIIFFAHWLSSFFALEIIAPDRVVMGWTLLALWYFVWIATFDQLFYTILGGK
jgi:hypothetical protein